MNDNYYYSKYLASVNISLYLFTRSIQSFYLNFVSVHEVYKCVAFASQLVHDRSDVIHRSVVFLTSVITDVSESNSGLLSGHFSLVEVQYKKCSAKFSTYTNNRG